MDVTTGLVDMGWCCRLLDCALSPSQMLTNAQLQVGPGLQLPAAVWRSCCLHNWLLPGPNCLQLFSGLCPQVTWGMCLLAW
jgi:hypothetical protein